MITGCVWFAGPPHMAVARGQPSPPGSPPANSLGCCIAQRALPRASGHRVGYHDPRQPPDDCWRLRPIWGPRQRAAPAEEADVLAQGGHKEGALHKVDPNGLPVAVTEHAPAICMAGRGGEAGDGGSRERGLRRFGPRIQTRSPGPWGPPGAGPAAPGARVGRVWLRRARHAGQASRSGKRGASHPCISSTRLAALLPGTHRGGCCAAGANSAAGAVVLTCRSV